MKVQAKIYYKILPTHPDKDCVVGGWDPEREMSYDDTYHIDPNYFEGMDDIKTYIKHDLALIAGGGYETKHIKDVRYEMEVVE